MFSCFTRRHSRLKNKINEESDQQDDQLLTDPDTVSRLASCTVLYIEIEALSDLLVLAFYVVLL